MRRARDAFAEGDFRWVAQVVNHVVFAEPTHAEALALQADALEQLGYGSENGTWRNFYLTGALELRRGPVGSPTTTASADFLRTLSLDQLFDALSIRVDGPRSWDADISVRWNVTGGEPVTLRLRNGVLTHIAGTGPAVSSPDVEVALDEAALRAVLLGSLPRRNYRDAPPSPGTRRRSPNSSATSAPGPGLHHRHSLNRPATAARTGTGRSAPARSPSCFRQGERPCHPSTPPPSAG